jgi:hypothetical protein
MTVTAAIGWTESSHTSSRAVYRSIVTVAVALALQLFSSLLCSVHAQPLPPFAVPTPPGSLSLSSLLFLLFLASLSRAVPCLTFKTLFCPSREAP